MTRRGSGLVFRLCRLSRLKVAVELVRFGRVGADSISFRREFGTMYGNIVLRRSVLEKPVLRCW